MTRDEFLHKYHRYQTQVKQEAIDEAKKVNEIGIDGEIAVPVYFSGLGYCLMTKSAFEAIKDIMDVLG